jgi:hypothetical protein
MVIQKQLLIVDGDATDETYNGSNYGSCNFPQPKIDDAYIPYLDLTKEQVLNWCWNNGVDKDTIEKNVTAQIESQINPPISQLPLPWSN